MYFKVCVYACALRVAVETSASTGPILMRLDLFLLSQRESFVTVKIFESKILMNFDVFEVPESE